MPAVEQSHLDLNMTPPNEEEVNIPGVHQHAEPEIDQDEIDPGVGDINMDPGQDAVGEQNLVHCDTYTASESIPVKIRI